MGVETAIAGLALSAFGTVQQQEAQSEARKAQQNATEEQKKARAEQEAMQAAQAAEERRRQIREARIKRAQVLQASANTGTSASSGEAGATGGISTQLGSNIGFNLGMINSAQNISAFNQATQDFLSSTQNSVNQANTWGQVGNLGLSIFGQSGGFNTLMPSQPSLQQQAEFGPPASLKVK